MCRLLEVIPVCVVIGQRIGDELLGQQEESPEQVNDAAGGEEEEGSAKADAKLV